MCLAASIILFDVVWLGQAISRSSAVAARPHFCVGGREGVFLGFVGVVRPSESLFQVPGCDL